MKTITIHSASWLYNPGQPPIPGGALAVHDGRILEIGTASELKRLYTNTTVAEHPGCVILPGFVNAHTHLELTHYPAWRLRGGLDYHPRTFADWIVQMVKVRRGVAAEEALASLKAGIETSLWAGTTCVGDIVTGPELLQAYRGVPGSGRLYLELIGQDTLLLSRRLQKALDALKTIEKPHYPALSPHASYTLNAAVLPAIAEAARQGEYPLSLHLAEAEAEDQLLFDSSGPLAELLYPLVGWSDFCLHPAAQPRRASLTLPVCWGHQPWRYTACIFPLPMRLCLKSAVSVSAYVRAATNGWQWAGRRCTCSKNWASPSVSAQIPWPVTILYRFGMRSVLRLTATMGSLRRMNCCCWQQLAVLPESG